MRLSYQLIQSFGTLSYGIALNSYQLKLLGVNWPPKSGWVGGLIGKEITDDLCNLLLELRGSKNKAKRKAILRKYGVSASRLFHKRPSNEYLGLKV